MSLTTYRNLIVQLLGCVSIALAVGQPETIPNEGKEHGLCARAERCLEELPLSLGPSPERRGAEGDWDAVHYHLDIELTLEYVDDALDKVKVSGTNAVNGTAAVDALSQVTLNLRSNMTVSGVTGDVAGFTRVDHEIQITLDHEYAAGESFDLLISYEGYPLEGGYGAFSFWERNGNPVIATLSEPYYAYYWWPCKDTLGDKATVETDVTVPDSLVAVSNGVLDGTDVLPDARVKYRWRTAYPMAVYLTSLAVTNYEIYELTYEYDDGQGTQTMPVYCYLYPDHWDFGAGIPLPGWKTGCDETLSILENLSTVYDQYPFAAEKYGLAETGGSGGLPASMEHQTVSSMYQINNYSDIVAHETAHQWWGDNVTCATWYDIWLNEGFASYSEALYREVKPTGGIESYWSRMNDRRPDDPDGQVYRTNIGSVNAIFSGNDVYDKGAWVLHMLRHVMGDESFFAGFETYRTAYQGSFATTADFESVMSDAFGNDLGFFFDEWVMSPGSGDYSWNYATRLVNGQDYLVLWVDQGQDVEDLGLITMPIDIRVTTAAGATTHMIWNDGWSEYYVWPVEEVPTLVEFDEDGGISDRNWVLNDRRKFVPGPLNAPPVVVDFQGQVFGSELPGQTVVDFYLSEDIGSLNAEAIEFVGAQSGAQDPVEVTYDALERSGQLVLAGLPDDVYTLTLHSTEMVANGLELDGEVSDSDWWDDQLLPSGDGQPGGDAEFEISRRHFDGDGDGEIDLLDFEMFSDCLNGPDGAYEPACDFCDADGDGDVDLVDFGAFQRNFGPV